jgi:hypothetical protein
VEADPVVADAEAKLGRVDALKALNLLAPVSAKRSTACLAR